MKLQKWSVALVGIVLAVATLALLGWILEIEILRRPLPHVTTMNPLTAVLFIFSSIAFFVTSTSQNHNKRYVATCIIIVVLTIASYKIIEILFALPFQADTVLFAKKNGLDLSQNRLSRMAPYTAINFILVSASLLFLQTKSKRSLLCQLPALAVLLLAWFSILGYCFVVPEFYGSLSYVPMAIQTTLSFFLFSLAILFINPKKGLMKLMTSPYSGSALAKVLVPYVIIVPSAIGYIHLWGQWKRLMSPEFGVAILVLSFIVISIFIILISTRSLNKKDIQEKLFMRRLEFANVRLQEINEKLITSNTHLVDLNHEIKNAKLTIEQQADVIIKQKNDELNQYRQNLDILFNNTREAILLLDSQGTVVLFNKTFRDFIESTSTKTPAVGKLLTDVVADERKEAANTLLQLALQGQTSAVEVNFQTPYGIVTRSLCYQPIWQDGKITHVSTTSFDITEQKKQEDIIRQSEANLKALFENTLDSYLLLADDFKVIAFNQGYYQAVMLQTNKVLKAGESILDYIIEDDRREAFRLMLLRTRSGEPIQYEAKLGTRDEPKWFNIAITQVKGNGGEFLGYCISTHDRTEIKKAELELRKSEERFRAVVENSDDIFCLVNHERKIFYASPSFTRILGYTTDEIQEMHRKEVIHPDDIHHYTKTFDQAINNPGKLVPVSCRVRHKDGHWLRMEGTIINLFHLENINCIISTYHDATSRYRVAEELEKLSLVASNTSNSVVILNKEGCIEWVNTSFTKLTEYSLDEVRDVHYISFLKQTDKSPSIINLIEEKMRLAEPVSVEVKTRSKSGRRYWIKLDVSPVFSELGTLKNFVSVKSDISDQKEYENEITTIARELGSLIENSNVPIFGVDRNGYINEWNNVTAALTHMTKNEVLGKKLVNIFIEHIYREIINDLLSEILSGKSINNFELPFLTKEGDRKILLLSATPRWTVDGVLKGVILVAQDITELIEYRQGLEIMVQDRTKELNEALKKEKELVEMKSRFVSVVSHEFRTPLSTISLTTGLIKRYKEKLTLEELDKNLDTIEKQVHHMNYMLEDVLAIGKVEAGKIHVNLMEINIKDFFTEISNQVQNSTNKSHSIIINIDSNKNVMVSDPRMLRIITTNLLTNAAKFSPGKSEIVMNISRNKDMIIVEVVDEGLGIPEDDIENLFSSFHRGSNIGTIEGTGLGLSIVRKTVDLLKGSISVKSKVMEGTIFTVSIPINE